MGLKDYFLHFLVNINCRLFTVVLMFRYLFSEKDMFIFLPERKGTELFRHSPLSNHLSCKVSCPFKIIAGACCPVMKGDLLCCPATEQDRKSIHEIFPGIGISVIYW